MRSTSPQSSAAFLPCPPRMAKLHVGLLAALGLGLTLGACAGRQSSGNACLDRCTSLHAASSLERSSCELDCNSRVSAAPTPNRAGPEPAPDTVLPPTPGPAPAQPGAPVAKTYPQSDYPQGNYPQTGARPQPTPTPSQPTTLPSTPPGPSMAELQRQRGLCESQCDSEGSNSDRATCRLQCAQITNRPTTTTPSGTPTYVNPPGGQGGQGGMQPAPADRAQIAACENTCNSDATAATDRATCRLNCNAVGTVGPAPSSYYVLHGSAPPDANTRADVIRSSQGVAPGAAPPVGTPAQQQKFAQCASQAQQCTTTCSARMTPCNAGCDQGKLSATDRATCKLTCESDVDGCRDDCRIKEGTCRGAAKP